MTLIDVLEREKIKAGDPRNFPPKLEGQTLTEYWTFWTPARLVDWREARWRAAGMDGRAR